MAAFHITCEIPEVELTKEECLANGMSEKEYDIQKALGTVPEESTFLREFFK